MLFVNYVKDDKDAKDPAYNYNGDAGFDLSCLEEEIIPPLSARPIKLSTGLRFKIPEGYFLGVFSRSGLAAKNGIFVLNSPGVVDSTYTGIVQVLLYNMGEEAYKVQKGDRIAQGIIIPCPKVQFIQKAKLEETERGDKGFGSTGE